MHCNSCFFITDKVAFGSYPTQDEVDLLEDKGVRYFINLTYTSEKRIKTYKTRYKKIAYPILDRRAPINWESFAIFIVYLRDTITNMCGDEKMYIHCKGGHGRSGLVAACLICEIFNEPSISSLQYIKKCHSSRLNMRDCWRWLGSPQTYCQKYFVNQFYNPLYICSANKVGIKPFTIPQIVLSAFIQSFIYARRTGDEKEPETKMVVSASILDNIRKISNTIPVDSMEKLNKTKDPIIPPTVQEEQGIVDALSTELYTYIEKDHELKTVLLKTGLRPIYDIEDEELNVFGKALMQVRIGYFRRELARTEYV